MSCEKERSHHRRRDDDTVERDDGRGHRLIRPEEIPVDAKRGSARLIRPDESGLSLCGERLRKGGLVAFPTETVYGLGANALDRDAVLSIFETKRRPLTDPVIVHVGDATKALAFVAFETKEGLRIFETLTKACWPGPLTLVAKAKSVLPSEVSAGTGFVGVRCPAHPIAKALLRHADVPIAAPSANLFGHVSPTRSAHVMSDLGRAPILIVRETIRDEDEGDDKDDGSNVCEVGIESTVVKIDERTRELVVFRRGGVPVARLRDVLLTTTTPVTPTGDAGDDATYTVRVLTKTAEMDTDEGQQAPGQMITHYAPYVTTSILRLRDDDDDDSRTSKTEEDTTDTQERARKRSRTTSRQDPLAALPSSVVVDCGGRLACLRTRCLAYVDISSTGDMSDAARHLFKALRYAETVPNATHVFLADVTDMKGDHTEAVKDRMIRAASGTTVTMSRPPASSS